MNDALAGANATLFLLSAGYLFFIVRYQYQTRTHEAAREVSIYKWVVSLSAMGIFVLSLLYFLFDFDLIFKSQQRDIGVIPNILFAVHLVIAIIVLQWHAGRILIPSSIVFGILVFMAKFLM